jgi:hypothetical protein
MTYNVPNCVLIKFVQIGIGMYYCSQLEYNMGKEEINITDRVSSVKIKIEDEDMKPLNQVSEKPELQLSALKKNQ